MTTFITFAILIACGWAFVLRCAFKPDRCKCKSATFSRKVDEQFRPICGGCGKRV